MKKWWNWLKTVLFQHPAAIYYLQKSNALPMPLERQEEKEMLEKMKKGDHDARDKLIEHNLRLVVYIAKRYETSPVLMEDLISIGTIGLIKAVGTFDADKNIKLVTYASRCIENEILMCLRKKSRTRQEVSLDEPLNVDYDGNELLLSDILGTKDDLVVQQFYEKEDCIHLYRAMEHLNEEEQLILKLRYGLGCNTATQKEIADQMGISQSYISRLEKKILHKLKIQLMKD